MTALNTNTQVSTLSSVLLGEYVINKKGDKLKVSQLHKQYETVGIYFSAHWCPPCKRFTPQLKDRLEHWQQNGKRVQVIFVSCDRKEDEFSSYYKSMGDWLTIPFRENQRRSRLSTQLNDERSIPKLVFLDSKTGEVNSKQGRTIVERDPNGVDFPWKDYAPAYQPPSIWSRVIIRVGIIAVIFLFFVFYRQQSG